MSKKFHCNICDSSFPTKYCLERHIENTKYCKSLRTQIEENNQLKIDIENYKKQIELLSQNNIELQSHLKISNEIENERKMRCLNKKILIENLTPITDDQIKLSSKLLTLDTAKNGFTGYAKWMLSFLKNYVICTDESRNKLVWKNETEDDIVNDINGNILLKKVFSIVYNSHNKILQKEIDNCLKELKICHSYENAYYSKEMEYCTKRRDEFYSITKLSVFSRHIIKHFISDIKKVT